MRTFVSRGKLTCICINQNLISIDCVLVCSCGANVQMWFLVESENSINNTAPKVRIVRRNERLNSSIIRHSQRYGEFSELLDKAEVAYWNDLGAGALVYLRKIFEKVTVQVAITAGIEYPHFETGNPRNFKQLLMTVDEQYHIIPSEFSDNGYRLFQELSNVVHGDYNEEVGLDKFESLYRLVVGILENVSNKQELRSAVQALGWNSDGGETA